MPTPSQIANCAVLCAEGKYMPLIEALTKRVAELESKLSAVQRVEPNPLDETLYNALREKRMAVATEMGVPPYCVATNKMLNAMIASKPKTLDDLRKIYGFGPNKVKLYGEVFLKVIADWS